MIWGDVISAYLLFGAGVACGGSKQAYDTIQSIDGYVAWPEFILTALFVMLIWPYALYEEWSDA